MNNSNAIASQISPNDNPDQTTDGGTIQLQCETDIAAQNIRTRSIPASPDSDRALRDRLCIHVSPCPIDHQSSINPVPSPSSTSSTSSFLVNALDVTETKNSSRLSDKRPSQRSPRFTEELNWCDRLDLEKNLGLVDEKQKTLIQSIITKQDNYADGFELGTYFANVLPIVASGFVNAEKMVFCGAFHSSNRRPCRQWQFCSRCAFYRGAKSYQMYKSAFRQTTFCHLTCSFDGGLALDSTNCVELRDYWKANEAAVRMAYNDGMIDGAYLVHELKILSFLPLRVLPHSHVLISGDVPTDDRLAAISECIAAGEGVTLPPSLVCPTIADKVGFERVIKYQTKAIDLKVPYDSALIKHGRGRLLDLNLQMREFLDSFSAAIDHFPKIIRIGNLQPQKQKGFIGTKLEGKESRKKAKYRDTRTIIRKK